jgi:hypothetical protein
MEQIRSLVLRKRLAFKRHAAIRMRQRSIFVHEVEEALIDGKIIEDYSRTQPLPSYLILGHTRSGRPIHVVVGIDLEDEMIWAITVYEPSRLEWNEGLIERKKKTI